MKKFIIFSSVIALSLILLTPVLAKDFSLPDISLTPDNPFYFLKSWKESIQTFFTFGLENKAKQYLHLAGVRLAEYQKMMEIGKIEIAGKTLNKYQDQLNRALEKANELKQQGKDIKDLTQGISQIIPQSLEILQNNLQKIPEQARKGIENAIENSQKVIENILGNQTEKVCTQEAKICPDGTAVGRSGPNCEFGPCPIAKDETTSGSTTLTTSWKTYRNEEYGFEVKYPPNPYRTKYYTEKGQLPITSDMFAVSFAYYCPEPLPENIPVFSWNYIIKVADNSSNLPLREWISGYEVEATAPHGYYSEYPNTLDFKLEDTYVAGIKGLIARKLGINPNEGEGGFIEDKIYIPGQQKIYIIESSWDGQAEINSSKGQGCLDKQTKILNQILSTFKFIK